MCDIWDSAHICTLDRLTSGGTSCTHSRALFSDESTNQGRATCDISLWCHVSCHFILRLRTSEPGLQPLHVCACEYSHFCSLCTFQRCGRWTEWRERARMRAGFCGTTLLLRSCKNWRVWLQVLKVEMYKTGEAPEFASVLAFRSKMKHQVSTFPPCAAKTHVRVIISATVSVKLPPAFWRCSNFGVYTGEIFILPLKQWKDTTLLFLYVKIVSQLLVFLTSITNLEKGRGMFFFKKKKKSCWLTCYW